MIFQKEIKTSLAEFDFNTWEVKLVCVSSHPLQLNDDVSSEVQEFVGDPSILVEALEAVWGDGSLQNIYIFINALQKLVFYLKNFWNQVIR